MPSNGRPHQPDIIDLYIANESQHALIHQLLKLMAANNCPTPPNTYTDAARSFHVIRRFIETQTQ